MFAEILVIPIHNVMRGREKSKSLALLIFSIIRKKVRYCFSKTLKYAHYPTLTLQGMRYRYSGFYLWNVGVLKNRNFQEFTKSKFDRKSSFDKIKAFKCFHCFADAKAGFRYAPLINLYLYCTISSLIINVTLNIQQESFIYEWYCNLRNIGLSK